MDWVETHKSVPQKDAYGPDFGARKTFDIHVRDDEAGQDEEKIDPQIATSDRRQYRAEADRKTLIAMKREHQERGDRPDARQGRDIAY